MNLTESKPLDNVYRFVWEFTPSQGNGTIAAVALTSKQGGVAGYGSMENPKSAFRQVMETRLETQTARELGELWSMLQMIFAGIGGWLGYFLGGCGGLIIALLLFVVMDYITGIMCAVADKKLSSEVGFKGICRKVLIFMFVGIANVLDVQVIGTGSVLRTAVIFFYLSNESISLLEKAGHLGLPIPEKLKKVLEQLHDRREEDKDGE